jgi:hypothetical protein
MLIGLESCRGTDQGKLRIRAAFLLGQIYEAARKPEQALAGQLQHCLQAKGVLKKETWHHSQEEARSELDKARDFLRASGGRARSKREEIARLSAEIQALRYPE